jgi:hypothetical protein
VLIGKNYASSDASRKAVTRLGLRAAPFVQIFLYPGGGKRLPDFWAWMPELGPHTTKV